LAYCHEQSSAEHFGVCPTCRKTDGFLNVNNSHWFVCDEHKVCWLVGENLFSNWREESEADWKRNREKLEAYKVVEPAQFSDALLEANAADALRAVQSECRVITSMYGMLKADDRNRVFQLLQELTGMVARYTARAGYSLSSDKSHSPF
jgi:hypothetical protein